MPLLNQIDQWGRLHPEHLAHRSDNRTLTYGELLTRSNALASRLQAELGDNRSPIAIHGHKEPEMLIAFLGVVKSGRPYVPIDRSIPPARVTRITQAAGTSITLTPAEIDLWSQPHPNSHAPLPKPVSGHDPFYILFTSGSSGEPKGVVITLANLECFVDWILAEHQFPSSSETFLNQAPFSFDLSVMDLYASLATGGTLFSITQSDIGNFKSLYAKFASSKITTWVSTPSFAQICLAERTFAEPLLPNLQRFLFCGETLSTEVASQLLHRFPKAEVWNTYGPTEATVATTSIQITPSVLNQGSPLSIGRPMTGTQVLILDPLDHIVPEGERGEIVIVGPNVSPGYLGRPDLNAQAFRPFEGAPAYHTGDWGRTRQGHLFFEGRQDNQVKLHGYRIELGDLEANLRSLPEITDAVVLPLEKDGQIESLVAVVILTDQSLSTDFIRTAEIKNRLSQRIPTYMVPRKFLYLTSFPITSNGKTDRRKLAELLP